MVVQTGLSLLGSNIHLTMNQLISTDMFCLAQAAINTRISRRTKISLEYFGEPVM